MDEIWKNISGFEGIYQVSNFGRIKSNERKIKHWRGGNSILKELILKPRNSKGYSAVILYKGGKKYWFDIHRIVALTFIHNPLLKREVNHINGIKTDNRVENLEWVTPSENIQHAISTGLSNPAKGEKIGTSKLKNKHIVVVRNLFNENPKSSRQNVANFLNVSKSTINQIISRKIWKHI